MLIMFYKGVGLKTRRKLLNHTTDVTFYKLLPTRKKYFRLHKVIYEFEVSCYGLLALIVGVLTFIVSVSVAVGCSEICDSRRVKLIQLGR